MLITIEVVEARDNYGLFATDVLEVRSDVSEDDADMLKISDLHRKIKTLVNKHLIEQIQQARRKTK